MRLFENRYATLTALRKTKYLEMNKHHDKLKIIESQNETYDKSHKIYLTLDLNLDEDEFKNLKSFEKVYRSELLAEFGYNLLKDNENRAHKFISEKIIKSSMDLLIGNCIWDLSNILSIQNIIKKENKSIDRLYIPSLKRRKDTLAKSQETYQSLNRWIDEPPGHLEELYDKFTITLLELKKGLEKSDIKIMEI